MSGPNIPPVVLIFKDYIPNRIRLYLCLIFAVIFQLSGGVYLAVASQMYQSLALLQEDIMMAGYAGFIGMTIIFPVLFRLKFRFMSRSILLFVCPAIIVCNLVAQSTDDVRILIIVSFVAGICRMWGTFECLSNAQLSITPTRNFAIFFPVVYSIVLGCIQISGLVAVHLDAWGGWRLMHGLIILLLVTVWVVVYVFGKPFRLMKPLPLYGIDWTGALLWTLFLFSWIFVLVYGKHYDWLDSVYIRFAITTGTCAFVFGLYRMFTTKRPYLSPALFSYPHTSILLFLFMALCILLSTSTSLQNRYVFGILHYDALNVINLNYWALGGTLFGGWWAVYWLTVFKGSYKTALLLSFGCIMIYQAMLYWLITPDMSIHWLYGATFIRSLGYIVIYIVLTVYVSSMVPFEHFFQYLSLLGFIRTGIGNPFGGTFIQYLYDHLEQLKWQSLTVRLDAMHLTDPLGFMPHFRGQVMLACIKDIYGWFLGMSVLIVVIIALTHLYPIHHYRLIPTFRQILRSTIRSSRIRNRSI